MATNEIIGYSPSQLRGALAEMESTLSIGEGARVTLCTETLPTAEDLEVMYLGMLGTGHHVSRPASAYVNGVAVTSFLIKKGSPQWELLIPVIPAVIIAGIIVFAIAKISEIARALTPIIGITVVGLVLIAAIAQKPATKYLERERKLLPAAVSKDLEEKVRKKALAAR